MKQLTKKSILTKTLQVSGLTFLSRLIAIFREFLQVSFFGLTALSDAFIVAFRIPNFFRHIFAEGALNASFVPVFVTMLKSEKKEHASGLMTLSFLFFQGILLALYAVVFLKTEWVMKLLAPGFSGDQSVYAVIFLRILFPFIFLVSSCALLGGALNAVNNFSIPAFGPALWNIFYVMSLGLCLYFKLSPVYLCFGVIVAGVAQVAINFYAYFKSDFTFGAITPGSIAAFRAVLSKFFPYLLGVSVVEINLFVGGIVASYLPQGSISILHYGGRFMNIPLGVFAVAFASVMLPQFSRLALYAPKRMGFYVLEVAKFVSWVIIPTALVGMLIAPYLFQGLFYSKKVAPELMSQAVWVLVIYLSGLLFFCLNKLFLSMFYALKDPRSTAIVSSVGALVNVVGDIVGVYFFGIYGIAGAAALSGFVMTVLCLVMLKKRHAFSFYGGMYFNFLVRYFGQLSACAMIFLSLHKLSFLVLSWTPWNTLFLSGFVSAALTVFLAVCTAVLLLVTKRWFRIKLYFMM